METVAYFGVAVVVLVVVYLIAKKSQKKRSKRPTKPGTVVLHQFPRHVFTRRVITGSPPCLKLETFLRMAKLPYENDFSMIYSKKGKMPWIEFNGQEIADSNFCVRFLHKEFQVNVDSHLSATDRAIGHSILTMLEENTYWSLVYTRMLSDYGAEFRDKVFGRLFLPMKYLAIFMTQKKVRNYLWSHGIGRHTEEEMYGITERDLLAVSEILGEKKFLFGEKPCLADASLFAFVAGCAWDLPECPVALIVESKAQNLDKHAHRMKELFYPDWEEIIAGKIKSE